MEITYTEATGPAWANEDQTAINLMVKFNHLPAAVPFTALPGDAMAHGRELFARAAAGDFGEVAAYVAPPAVVDVPAKVTRFQAMAALLHVDRLGEVEAIMAAASTPPLYKLAWREAAEFERASPTIAAIAEQLQLTPAQVDALFVYAAQQTA